MNLVWGDFMAFASELATTDAKENEQSDSTENGFELDEESKTSVRPGLFQSQFTNIFCKHQAGRFNSKYGNFINHDIPFWKNLKENVGKSQTSNDSIRKRCEYFYLSILLGELGEDKKEEKSNLEKQIKETITEIHKKEYEEPPTEVPSISKFMEKIPSPDKPRGKNLFECLKVAGFAGYDMYLLKQFLLATKGKFNKLEGNADEKLKELQNQEAFSFESNEDKKLGGGKYNTVYLIKKAFQERMQNGGAMVWKPVSSANKKAKEGFLATSALSGISRKATDALLVERSVLTKRLDELLYPGNSVCAATTAANAIPSELGENTQSGVLMEKAKGHAVAIKEVKFDLSKEHDEVPENTPEDEIFKDEQNKKSFDKIKDFIPSSNQKTILNLLKQKDAERIMEFFPNSTVNIKKDIITLKDVKMQFKNEKVFSQALGDSIRLGILDYIAGQTDRHYENYYIDDKTGSIMAIDNDMAFGGEVGARGQKKAFFIPNKASLLVNLPKVITSDIKKDLENFFSGEGCKQFIKEVSLSFGNYAKETIGVRKRLEDVSKLVGKDSDVTVTDDIMNSLDLIDTETNYLARDLLVNRKGLNIIDKQSWNAFRANREGKSLSNENIQPFIEKPQTSK